MLSTGVTSRDTHGSLFQDPDGRLASWLSVKKQAFSDRCQFCRQHATCCFLIVHYLLKKGFPLLVLETVFSSSRILAAIADGLQHKNSLLSNICSFKLVRGKAPGKQALAPYIPPLEAGGFYGAFHKLCFEPPKKIKG